jgi:hypothetical protein
MVVEVCFPRVNRRGNAVSRRVRDAIPLSFAHATISEGGYRLQARLTSIVQSKIHCKLIASLGSVTMSMRAIYVESQLAIDLIDVLMIRRVGLALTFVVSCSF